MISNGVRTKHKETIMNASTTSTGLHGLIAPMIFGVLA